MDRRRLLVAVVAVLCVVGLALAAATVSTPTSSDSGTGDGEGDGSGDSSDDGPELTNSSGESSGASDLPLIVGAVVFLGTMLLAIYALLSAFNLRQFVAIAITLLVVGAIAFVLLAFVLTNAGYPPPPDVETVTAEPGPSDGSGGRTAVEDPKQSTDIPIALFGVIGLAVLVLLAVVYRFSGDDTEPEFASTAEGDADDEDDDDAVTAVGQAAGRAADRIDSPEIETDNAIYRAWQEMTDALDVEAPRPTTPEEFAAVAIEAGMAPDDVRELTWLFEEVRYGEKSPSAEREQRATDALRRIQSAYAGGETDE